MTEHPQVARKLHEKWWKGCLYQPQSPRWTGKPHFHLDWGPWSPHTSALREESSPADCETDVKWGPHPPPPTPPGPVKVLNVLVSVFQFCLSQASLWERVWSERLSLKAHGEL